MARILTIFGPFEPHRRQLQFPKISNERKIIESIESIDSIERSRDRSDRSEAAVLTNFVSEDTPSFGAFCSNVLHALRESTLNDDDDNDDDDDDGRRTTDEDDDDDDDDDGQTDGLL